MISNIEATSLLNSKGYNAKCINGVVMIESDDKSDLDKMRRILKKAGYNASYGWKKITKASIQRMKRQIERMSYLMDVLGLLKLANETAKMVDGNLDEEMTETVVEMPEDVRRVCGEIINDA